MAVDGPEDQLAWEARHRTRAAIAAAVAGVFVFVGVVWRALTLRDLPDSGLVESLDRAAEPGAVGALESLRVDSYQVLQDEALGVLASSAVVAIGYLALGWALTYLAVAARARRPEMPRPLVYLPMIAGLLLGLATVLREVALLLAVNDFLDGDRTLDAAREVPRTGFVVFVELIRLVGGLGIGLTLILVSLNAMRVGLLTRFMGVLGIVTGTFTILPIAGPLPLVQSFWLLTLGLQLSGRTAGGLPPAWRTGNAEPWPSSAEVREQRRRAAAESRGEPYEPPQAAEPEPEPEPVSAGPSPSASARKRKRKRR